MFGVTRHLRVGVVTVVLLLCACIPLQASAGQTVEATEEAGIFDPEIIITEFQTNGGSASQEFVELHNTTDADIALGEGKTTTDHWKLQFFGSTLFKDGLPTWTANPSNTLVLKGTIPAYGYIVFSTSGYQPGGVEIAADQHYGTAASNFMTDTAGGLRLTYTTVAPLSAQVVHDELAWMDPAKKPTSPVLSAPAKTLSQQRHPFEDDTYISDQNILAGFGGESQITPLESWIAPVVVEPEVPGGTDVPVSSIDPDTPSPELPVTSEPNAGLAPPVITELLPNPAAPAKDETDEYIELYNPNQEDFNLKGYSIQVGLTTSKEFTFTEDVLLSALSYRAFLSSETRLSLTNTGSQVRLLSPDGTTIYETAAYGAADDGATWSLADGAWQWSATPTPGLVNVLTAMTTTAAKKTAVAATAKPTAKKATAKTAATKPKGVAKAAKAKTVKAKKAAKPKTAAAALTTEKPPRAPIHTGVLVAVVGVAVLYAAYEYRHDIANRFYRLRGNRTARA